MDPKYPEITVQLAGEDGNAFAIMARVTSAMKKHGVPKEEQELYRKESMSGDYDNLLQTAMKWVNAT